MDSQTHNQNWIDENGNHQGGVSLGIGFTIAWQRGPLTEGRNGAFLLEVLAACQHQLVFYQGSKFACPENAEALEHIEKAVAILQQRRDRRQQEGTLGTHEVDQ